MHHGQTVLFDHSATSLGVAQAFYDIARPSIGLGRSNFALLPTSFRLTNIERMGLRSLKATDSNQIEFDACVLPLGREGDEMQYPRGNTSQASFWLLNLPASAE